MIYKLINIEQRHKALKKHSLLKQINANACVNNLKQKYDKYLKDNDIAEIRKNIHLELIDEIDYLYRTKVKTWEELHYPYILEYESAILDQNIISLRNNSLQNIEPNYFRDYLFEIIRLNDLEKIWVKEHG